VITVRERHDALFPTIVTTTSKRMLCGCEHEFAGLPAPMLCAFGYTRGRPIPHTIMTVSGSPDLDLRTVTHKT